MTSYVDQQDGRLPSGLDPAGQAWFAAIVDSSADAIIGLTPETTIAGWNAAAARLYGHSADDAVGRDAALVLPPDRTEEIRSMLDGLRPGASPASIETVHIRKEGRPIEVSVTASPVATAAGKALGAVLVVREAASGRRGTEDAEEKRRKLLSALSASDIGTFLWHVTPDRLEWDDNLRRLFGLDAGTEIRRMADFLERVHPDDRDALVSEVRRCLAERRRFVKEFRILHPDGSIRWIADTASASYDEAGHPVYLTGACRDVTDRNRVEAELSSALAAKEDLIQQKDVLLKEVNHRVKNSLQLVSSLLNLQSLSIDDPTVRQQFSEACSRIAMVAAVHERLYRTGKVQTVEFGPYLHQMCGDVASAATYGRSRRVVVETADLDIETDRAIPLALIVNELLTNALKYAYAEDQDGEVRVVSEIDGDGRLRVCVADDGVGFPDGFDPATSDTLGMKLIRALAAQLHGELTIPRDRPGACVELCI